MFLRKNKRFKDGKEHRYWSVVESRRVSPGKSVQKTLLYLGEINDSERASWTCAIEAFGYSRDKRPDCLQIVIALIVTPDGLPIAYEVMRGNTSDKTTLRDMLEKIAAQYGKERRTWIMDRGIPTESVLEEMRAADPAVSYLVGTPKGRLTKLGKELAAKTWDQVKDDVSVKLLPKDNELYVLARSIPRRAKERAMRQKKLKAYWARLKELQTRATLGRDELLLAIGAAKQKAGRNAHRLVTLHLPGATSPVNKDTFRFELDRKKLKRTRLSEGQYLLRSNLTGEDPAALWQNYMNLVRIEESFRTLKSDLGLRPVHHQLDGRIEAHIFISFLSYCLYITLEKYNQAKATGLSARSVLARFAEIQMLDVKIPTTDGREIHMKRHTKPEKLHQLLLTQLGLTLPAQPPPEIKAQDIPVV